MNTGVWTLSLLYDIIVLYKQKETRMPLLSEYGYQPGFSNLRTIRPLVQEPSEEWIRHFGDNFEDEDPFNPDIGRRSTNQGKFVAVRNLLLLAPFPVVILHRHIIDSRNVPVDLGPRITEEVQLARQENMPLLFGPTPVPLTDAGGFIIHSRQGEVQSVLLTGESHDFKRGDENMRAATAGLLQAALGDRIDVEF